MTWLIWWIRSWFCSHSFKIEEQWYKIRSLDYWGNYTGAGVDKCHVSATCTKCNWHRRYYKF